MTLPPNFPSVSFEASPANGGCPLRIIPGFHFFVHNFDGSSAVKPEWRLQRWSFARKDDS